VVTRVTGLPIDNIDPIASRLRKALGCGATVDGEDLLLLGTLVDRASAWLDRAGDLRLVVDEPAKPNLASRRPALDGTARTASPTGARGPGESNTSSGTRRADVRPGQRVAIVMKADQSTGNLTEGVVRDLLTSSPTHPRGIKVRLESGEVGRVKIVFG
jgi:uncharacterized repeat protein (TIGR03833 family)